MSISLCVCVCLWDRLWPSGPPQPQLLTPHLNSGTLGFNNSRFHLLDAWAEERIVQVHLAGSLQADIWRALRLQET